MTDYLQVSTTAATASEAERIATTLVEKRLAACVQIIPHVSSVYRWQGKVEQAKEWLCLAKTRRSRLPQVEAEICQLHGYECPEIIAVTIEGGSSNYLSWLDEQLES